MSIVGPVLSRFNSIFFELVLLVLNALSYAVTIISYTCQSLSHNGALKV